MKSISQSPTDPAFVQDPYPFYERARGLGDIVWWEEYGMPLALSHAAAETVLKHPKLGRAPKGGTPGNRPPHLQDFYALEDQSLLELDGPDHTRLRRRVVRVFSPARVMEMSATISRISDDLIDALPDGPFDFITAYAEVLPVAAISRLLGVPDEMGPQLVAWSHAMVAMYQARRDGSVEAAANSAARDFRSYLETLVLEKRARPGDDLISALIAPGGIDEALTEPELIGTVALLLNAGHEATVHALGNALYTLLRLNQPYAAVMPNSVTSAVEELFRFDPPLHIFQRYTHAEVAIAGHTFAPGEKIAACLAAANRDPKVWATSDIFDPTRPRHRQLSFGAGAHHCLGAPLARLEMQIAMPAVFSPALGLRLTEPPSYRDIYHFHGLDRLMVERTA